MRQTSNKNNYLYNSVLLYKYDYCFYYHTTTLRDTTATSVFYILSKYIKIYVIRKMNKNQLYCKIQKQKQLSQPST